MSLGSKLKDLRISHKMTLQEMADALNNRNPHSNFNKGRLSKWEHDTDEPRLSSLKQVADLFNVSIDYFFDDEKPDAKGNPTAEVIAAHIDDDTPESEREQIINFIENLKKARK
ncbi:helix-turn-helix transcriptional regulator [Limosilactobacillus pontis]|uniref:helix-turn-helix domain-containing protein n=1 Tax=Limosilactobacillus pontis TaxID=35787 RepID=UPI002F26DD4D